MKTRYSPLKTTRDLQEDKGELLSSKIGESSGKKYPTYSFKAKSPVFELFILRKKLDCIRNKIRTVYEWSPRLAIEKPEIDPKKILLELRKQESELKESVEKYLTEVEEENFTIQKEFLKGGDILQKYYKELGNVLFDASIRRSKQISERRRCPSDYYLYSSVQATEFREYLEASETNRQSEWLFMHGLHETTILNADTLSFDVLTWPQPGLVIDYTSFIYTIGLLKFNFPRAPCDIVIEWNAVVNIDFIIGANVGGEGDFLAADLWIREQPDSTSFPDVGIDDPGFQRISWPDLEFSYPSGRGRRSRRERIYGQFQVDQGMTSSLLIGPSIYALSSDESAGIGNMGDPTDNGRFWFNGYGDDCVYGGSCHHQDLSIDFLMRPQ